MSTPDVSTAIHLPVLKYSCELIEPERLALVDRFYRDHGYKVKCARHEQVFVVSNLLDEPSSHQWLAAVRLVPQNSGHYWLRNLLVVPTHRGLGLASRLLHHLKLEIAPQGCYCFALPHLTELYERARFVKYPTHCPPDILAIYERYQSRGRDWVLMGVLE